MKPIHVDVTLYEGNDATWPMTLSNLDGTPYDLTGAIIECGIAARPDVAPWLLKSSVDGGVVFPLGRTAGKFAIVFDAIDTVGHAGDWTCDVRLTTVAIKKGTFASGDFHIPGVVVR